MKLLLLFSALALLSTPAAEARRKKGESAIVLPTLQMRKPLRYPIVLVHGATTKGSRLKIGFMDFGDYFAGIPEYLGATGTPVKVVELTTDGSIGERAAVLKNYLETEFRGQVVNLVAHSLGGLDARYVVSVLGSRQVASITTIGTPHHGTPLATWADRQVRHHYPWYWIFRLLGYDMAKRRFLKEITPDYMEKIFNPKVPDSFETKYFYVATQGSYEEFSLSYLLWLTTRWLENEEDPMSVNGHDGMVPLDSQRWGKKVGEFEADHLAQINHHEFRSGDSVDISLNIYRNIYDNLSSAGL